MTSLLRVLSNSWSADSVQKGKSTFKGKLGQKVASSQVTLVDDGTYERGIASFPFDGEGWPSQRTVLIEQGELKGFLYDSYTARKDRTTSTGNGMRGSFRDLPSVGNTNFYMLPGTVAPERLWDDIERRAVRDGSNGHAPPARFWGLFFGSYWDNKSKGKLTYVRGLLLPQPL